MLVVGEKMTAKGCSFERTTVSDKPGSQVSRNVAVGAVAVLDSRTSSGAETRGLRVDDASSKATVKTCTLTGDMECGLAVSDDAAQMLAGCTCRVSCAAQSPIAAR